MHSCSVVLYCVCCWQWICAPPVAVGYLACVPCGCRVKGKLWRVSCEAVSMQAVHAELPQMLHRQRHLWRVCRRSSMMHVPRWSSGMRTSWRARKRTPSCNWHVEQCLPVSSKPLTSRKQCMSHVSARSHHRTQPPLCVGPARTAIHRGALDDV